MNALCHFILFAIRKFVYFPTSFLSLNRFNSSSSPSTPLLRNRVRIKKEIKREYFLLGSQRSGNNAVVAWILKATKGNVLKTSNSSFTDGRIVFLPRDRGSGFIQKTPVETQPALAANSWHLHGPTSRMIYRGSAKRGVVFGETDDAEWIAANEDLKWDKILEEKARDDSISLLDHFNQLYDNSLKIAGHSNIPQKLDAVIYHLEDFNPNGIKRVPWEATPLESTIESEKRLILVLRDLENWLSSRIKSGRNVDDRALNIWISSARIAESKGKSSECSLDSVTIIRYNRLARDKGYRRGIAKELGLSDDGLSDEVLVAGGGSSFEGIRSQGKGREMDTSNRFQLLDKESQAVIRGILEANPEAVRLNNLLFPENRILIADRSSRTRKENPVTQNFLKGGQTFAHGFT